jgi:hypothetical protein
MRRLTLWADEPDRSPLRLDSRVISLEPIRRERRDQRVQDAYDDGTTHGFFLGLAAAALAWLFLSGCIVRVGIWLGSTALYLLGTPNGSPP